MDRWRLCVSPSAGKPVRGRLGVLCLAAARTVALAAALAACGPFGVASMPPAGGLETLPVATVIVGPLELEVAVADSAAERTHGLTGVADLGALDGLLFEFPAEVETRFTMRGVLIRLDIAFIDAAGRVLDVQSMAVCEAEPCPPYAAPLPYRWAIETPADGLAGVQIGDSFRVER